MGFSVVNADHGPCVVAETFGIMETLTRPNSNVQVYTAYIVHSVPNHEIHIIQRANARALTFFKIFPAFSVTDNDTPPGMQS